MRGLTVSFGKGAFRGDLSGEQALSEGRIGGAHILAAPGKDGRLDVAVEQRVARLVAGLAKFAAAERPGAR